MASKNYVCLAMSGDGTRTVAGYGSSVEVIENDIVMATIGLTGSISEIVMSENGLRLIALTTNRLYYSVDGGYTWNLISQVCNNIAINKEGSYAALGHSTGIGGTSLVIMPFSNPSTLITVAGTVLFPIQRIALSNVTAGKLNAVILGGWSAFNPNVNYLYKCTDIIGVAPSLVRIVYDDLSNALYNNGYISTHCNIAYDETFTKFIIAIYMNPSQLTIQVPNSNTVFLYNNTTSTVTNSFTKIGFNWKSIACDKTGQIVTAIYNDVNVPDGSGHACYRSNDGGNTFYQVILNNYDIAYYKYKNQDGTKFLVLNGVVCDNTGFNISICEGFIGMLITDVIQFDFLTYNHLLKEYISTINNNINIINNKLNVDAESNALHLRTTTMNSLTLYPGIHN